MGVYAVQEMCGFRWERVDVVHRTSREGCTRLRSHEVRLASGSEQPRQDRSTAAHLHLELAMSLQPARKMCRS